jgi:hypothetical protein
MELGFQAFMAEMIDYAGLFPPAKLPLPEAIANYAEYRKGPESWMLSRFLCPAARLEELAPFGATHLREGPPLRFSVIGGVHDDPAAFLANLQKDLAEVARFRERHPGRVEVDVMELRLPRSLLGKEAERPLLDFLRGAVRILETEGPPSSRIYFEGGLVEDWRSAWPNLIEALARWNDTLMRRDAAHARARGLGFKLRCGGADASAFPSAEQVALAVTACRDHRLPFKATAGLHHPFRHLDPAIETKRHGFVNVFGAALLAHASNLDEGTIRTLILDERPENFLFGDAGFGWQGSGVASEEIQRLRGQLVTSFGSCSFEEPVADLKTLGLL